MLSLSFFIFNRRLTSRIFSAKEKRSLLKMPPGLVGKRTFFPFWSIRYEVPSLVKDTAWPICRMIFARALSGPNLVRCTP